MDSFGFTKKKFLARRYESQQKHIIKWLSSFYHTLTTNRVDNSSLEFFAKQYNQVLRWTDMDSFQWPEPITTRLCIETVSNRINLHRTFIDQSVRDYDLLEKIQTEDADCFYDHMDINCHIALDGMRSLFNTGSIFRICEAAGFSSVILGNSSGKEHPGVQKTAMGAEKWVEQEKTEDLVQTLVDKKQKGFQIIGVETVKESIPYYDKQWQKNTIVVFGNEEYGISSHVMAVCDEIVHIPMSGRKNSINVANAVSVICFHISHLLP